MEPCEDPSHPMNSAKYQTGRKCIDCDNPTGTGWGPYWCQPCNAARLMRIDRSLKGMLAEMQERATQQQEG